MYTLVLSGRFQKQLAKLLKGNPKIKAKVSKTLKLLNADIDHPSLRLHKLSGYGDWSISVTMSLRIIAHVEGDKIFLLDIGKHEKVY